MADAFTRACPVWRNSDRLRANAMPLCAWNELAEYPRPSLWPFVKVAFVGVFWASVLIGGAAYVLGVWG